MVIWQHTKFHCYILYYFIYSKTLVHIFWDEKKYIICQLLNITLIKKFLIYLFNFIMQFSLFEEKGEEKTCVLNFYWNIKLVTITMKSSRAENCDATIKYIHFCYIKSKQHLHFAVFHSKS